MKTFGINLAEGSQIGNLTVASGKSFPGTPSTGELFFRTDATSSVKGLYLYNGTEWSRLPTQVEMVVPNGTVLPSTPVEGQLFYKASDDITEALYYYDAENGWVAIGNVNATRHQHEQASANTTWVVSHGMALPSPYLASVDCFIYLNDVYQPAFPSSISFDSSNQLTVTWSTARAGYALVRK
jgi:hypothetical protein